MSGWRDAFRELRNYNLMEGGRRLVDDKPVQCTLYVTDRCNLDCAYCTEYDNSQPHPRTSDLKSWIRKIRDLGTMRIALVGGEPLMHPDIVEIVRYCREIGLFTSLTTNGFLLSRDLVGQLEAADLQTIQISVDRMTPSPITRKTFRTVLPKLRYFEGSPINVHITGVICEDTLDESRAVLATGLEAGFPSEIRLVHADPGNRFRVDRGDRGELLRLLEWMKECKDDGVRIHTSDALLEYQLSLVRGEPVDWTCTAGFKIFFVSARGQFWLCSMRPTDKHIDDVTADDLRSNYRKKSCQDGCGVYCVVGTSMIYERPLRRLGSEVLTRIRRLPGQLRDDAPVVPEGEPAG